VSNQANGASEWVISKGSP